MSTTKDRIICAGMTWDEIDAHATEQARARANVGRIATSLRAALRERGVSVTEAATVCGATREADFVRRMASGNMSVDWLSGLADLCGMKVSELWLGVPTHEAATR